MAIFITARWKAQPEAAEKVKQALREFVAAVKQNEPDTRLYTALEEVEGQAGYMTYFIFKNAAARDYHRSTDWVKRFTEAIYPENIEPVVFTEYELIASTDQ